MEKKTVSKKLVIIISVISVILVAAVLCAFVVFFDSRENNVVEQDNGAVLMTYGDEKSVIEIKELRAMDDKEGMVLAEKGTYFDFSVSVRTEDAKSIGYELALIPTTKSDLYSKVKVYLERQDKGSYVKVFEPKVFAKSTKKSELGAPVGSMVIAKFTKDKDIKDNYRLRIWIEKDTEIPAENTDKVSFEIKLYGNANN